MAAGGLFSTLLTIVQDPTQLGPQCVEALKQGNLKQAKDKLNLLLTTPEILKECLTQNSTLLSLVIQKLPDMFLRIMPHLTSMETKQLEVIARDQDESGYTIFHHAAMADANPEILNQLLVIFGKAFSSTDLLNLEETDDKKSVLDLTIEHNLFRSSQTIIDTCISLLNDQTHRKQAFKLLINALNTAATYGNDGTIDLIFDQILPKLSQRITQRVIGQDQDEELWQQTILNPLEGCFERDINYTIHVFNKLASHPYFLYHLLIRLSRDQKTFPLHKLVTDRGITTATKERILRTLIDSHLTKAQLRQVVLAQNSDQQTVLHFLAVHLPNYLFLILGKIREKDEVLATSHTTPTLAEQPQRLYPEAPPSVAATADSPWKPSAPPIDPPSYTAAVTLVEPTTPIILSKLKNTRDITPIDYLLLTHPLLITKLLSEQYASEDEVRESLTKPIVAKATILKLAQAEGIPEDARDLIISCIEEDLIIDLFTQKEPDGQITIFVIHRQNPLLVQKMLARVNKKVLADKFFIKDGEGKSLFDEMILRDIKLLVTFAELLELDQDYFAQQQGVTHEQVITRVREDLLNLNDNALNIVLNYLRPEDLLKIALYQPNPTTPPYILILGQRNFEVAQKIIAKIGKERLAGAFYETQDEQGNTLFEQLLLNHTELLPTFHKLIAINPEALKVALTKPNILDKVRDALLEIKDANTLDIIVATLNKEQIKNILFYRPNKKTPLFILKLLNSNCNFAEKLIEKFGKDEMKQIFYKKSDEELSLFEQMLKSTPGWLISFTNSFGPLDELSLAEAFKREDVRAGFISCLQTLLIQRRDYTYGIIKSLELIPREHAQQLIIRRNDPTKKELGYFFYTALQYKPEIASFCLELFKPCEENLLELGGYSALRFAIKNNLPLAIIIGYLKQNPELAKRLLLETDENGNTAMHLAALNNHADLIPLLQLAHYQDKGALRLLKNKGGLNFAQLLAKNGHFKALLQVLQSLLPEDKKKVLTQTDQDGNTAIHWAVVHNHNALIHLLEIAHSLNIDPSTLLNVNGFHFGQLLAHCGHINLLKKVLRIYPQILYTSSKKPIKTKNLSILRSKIDSLCQDTTKWLSLQTPLFILITSHSEHIESLCTFLRKEQQLVVLYKTIIGKTILNRTEQTPHNIIPYLLLLYATEKGYQTNYKTTLTALATLMAATGFYTAYKNFSLTIKKQGYLVRGDGYKVPHDLRDEETEKTLETAYNELQQQAALICLDWVLTENENFISSKNQKNLCQMYRQKIGEEFRRRVPSIDERKRLLDQNEHLRTITGLTSDSPELLTVGERRAETIDGALTAAGAAMSDSLAAVTASMRGLWSRDTGAAGAPPSYSVEEEKAREAAACGGGGGPK